MNLKTVTIADLKPHPDNPNTHPDKQIDALGNSLGEFDQVKSVVIWLLMRSIAIHIRTRILILATTQGANDNAS